ncbi:MAG: DHH family phosphoesterase [Candidatus Lokiarchaeota archaeon]|nr:DHH family phosphoesterase [Candidatus Lokiarchaeota archaeon]
MENSKDITFNAQLDELMKKTVSYFNTEYVARYRDHIESVQSQQNQENFFSSINIFSHIDTDGICAAAIMALALKRENISYQITILKQLNEHNLLKIKSILEENNNFSIFLDFGSGQINLLAEYLPNRKYIILDHHQPLKTEESIPISGFHANPYYAGINGSTGISAAGMSYLFVKKLRADNADLSHLAIIGALGDHQNAGDARSFIGENKAILEDAKKTMTIKEEVEPFLPRNISLPLGLANHLPEGINLFDEDPKKAAYFLKKVGLKYENDLGHPRFLPDLSSTEKTKLVSALTQKIYTENKDKDVPISKLIRTHYLLTQFKSYPEIHDATDFSTMLNATGRLEIPSIGIACCVNRSNNVIIKGIESSKEYTQKLEDGVSWLINGHKMTSYKGIIAFDGEDQIPELMVGVVCTILVDNSKIDKSKPIIGYAQSDGDTYKFSARCNEDLIQKGVNLSQAIRSVSANLGLKDMGGGHPPAAGAFIPKSMIRPFLTQLDEHIRAQQGEKIDITQSSSPEMNGSIVVESEVTPNKTKKTSKKSAIEKAPASKKKTKGLDQWGL